MSIIEKLDMTTIVDDYMRQKYNGMALLEKDMPKYDELAPTDRFYLKSQMVEFVVEVVKVSAPHIRKVVEAELIDERFVEAVVGIEAPELFDVDDAASGVRGSE